MFSYIPQLVHVADRFELLKVDRGHALDVAELLSPRAEDSRTLMNLWVREDGDDDPQCNNACLPQFEGTSAERSLEGVVLSRNASLVDCEMTLPGASVNDFMLKRVALWVEHQSQPCHDDLWSAGC